MQTFKLPIKITAIVGGTYRVIDMGNTTVNGMGDLVHRGRRGLRILRRRRRGRAIATRRNPRAILGSQEPVVPV